MASNPAQLRSSDNIDEDIKRVWEETLRLRELKGNCTVTDHWNRHAASSNAIEDLWWIVQRLQFRCKCDTATAASEA